MTKNTASDHSHNLPGVGEAEVWGETCGEGELISGIFQFCVLKAAVYAAQEHERHR